MTLLNISTPQQPECKTASCEAKQAESSRCVRPTYRVREVDTGYLAAVDLPGVPKDSIEISVAEGVLEVVGKRAWSGRDGWSPLAGVVEDGLSYRLRLSLGDEVDGEKISANLEAGVLNLTLGKAEEKKPRRIAVN